MRSKTPRVQTITLLNNTHMALNTQELALCDKLADCWNDFLQLEIMHPSERTEFMNAIHSAQNIVMARSAVRAHPDKFYRMLDGSQIPKADGGPKNIQEATERLLSFGHVCGKCKSTNVVHSSTERTNTKMHFRCKDCGEKILYSYWPSIKRLSNA